MNKMRSHSFKLITILWSVGICLNAAPSFATQPHQKILNTAKLLYPHLFKNYYPDNIRRRWTKTDLNDAKNLKELEFSEEHSEDLLSICYGGHHACSLLARVDSNNNLELVTLIGEQHDQEKEQYEKVAKLFEHYDVVGLEPTYPQDPTLLEKTLGSFFPDHPHSILNYSHRDKVILNLEKGVEIQLKSRKTLATQLILCSAALCTATAMDYIEDPRKKRILELGELVFLLGGAVNIAYGIYIDHEDQYAGLKNSVLKLRDQAMANHIETGLEKADSLVAGMGYGHLHGVRKFLLEKGFIDKSDAIRTERQKAGQSITLDDSQREEYINSDPLKLSILNPLYFKDDPNFSWLSKIELIEEMGTFYTTISFTNGKSFQLKNEDIHKVWTQLRNKGVPVRMPNITCGIYSCTPIQFSDGDVVTVYTSDADAFMKLFKD